MLQRPKTKKSCHKQKNPTVNPTRNYCIAIYASKQHGQVCNLEQNTYARTKGENQIRTHIELEKRRPHHQPIRSRSVTYSGKNEF